MLEFFVIFSKSGIVLFATLSKSLEDINGLIKHVFLEERTTQYQTEQLQIKHLLDNEFELVFVAGYQKFLRLTYVDKFLGDIQRLFRDKYRDFDLRSLFNKRNSKIRETTELEFCNLIIDNESILNFTKEFSKTYGFYIKSCKTDTTTKPMRTFQDSAKSRKTIASMIVPPKEPVKEPIKEPTKTKKVAKPDKKKGKEARSWELSGTNPEEFDFSKKSSSINVRQISTNDLETNLEITDPESEDEDTAASSAGSIWNIFGSISNKKLTEANLRPVLDQLRDHLTSKNVAAEIAEELCKSVCCKLEGQNVNTWVNVKNIAREALQEAIMSILNPSKTINILREIETKARPPYVIVFCGVNGVGKSTNLAKIANWLINNNVKVLVVACDTFRAGAIEQLKTHVMALKAMHERGKDAVVKIELFEKGYGRDSAAIAMEAVNYARNNQFNCVMVDTAGRMQDNEPLMRQLAKLIKINTPDLTLFVGEALVGNEAVDQLTKFNNSLLDCGCRVEGSSRSAIDGIVLTKFDTIDDQVGAAISMTHVTGQPIVFVGVGQTYRDLKRLDAKAVTRALMR